STGRAVLGPREIHIVQRGRSDGEVDEFGRKTARLHELFATPDKTNAVPSPRLDHRADVHHIAQRREQLRCAASLDLYHLITYRLFQSGWRVVSNRAAVRQQDDTVAALCLIKIMCRKHDRRAAFTSLGLQDSPRAIPMLGIEPHRGFIENEQV